MPLIVKDEAPFTRKDLQVYFEECGIQTRTVFTGNILRQPGFNNIQCKKSSKGYKNADQVMRGGMLIGCHQGMDDKQINYICDNFSRYVPQRLKTNVV
jgi:CDP-6-deoxy-D-xylo-4-hexulose-3-dehydrase